MGLPKKLFNLHSFYAPGLKNLITDVPGVKVGHVTIKDDKKHIHTGVTAVLPHGGNMFTDKVVAGVTVLNGFGKSVGLIQVDELGTIETPIIMTNTLSVGTALTAMVKYMLETNQDIGKKTGTVNCLITECNDARLNDIRGLHIKEQDVINAIKKANVKFEEGGVGGGTGMVSLGFKGGIGSASRRIKLDGKNYTIGALVMTNFGSAGRLTIGGDHIGERILQQEKLKKDNGSIIMLIGTDVPLSARQAKRLSRRAAISLGRTGSAMGNGSGDVAIAFSTGNIIKHYSKTSIIKIKLMQDADIDIVFDAAIEAVEESIISALYHGQTVEKGNTIKEARALKEYL